MRLIVSFLLVTPDVFSWALYSANRHRAANEWSDMVTTRFYAAWGPFAGVLIYCIPSVCLLEWSLTATSQLAAIVVIIAATAPCDDASRRDCLARISRPGYRYYTCLLTPAGPCVSPMPTFATISETPYRDDIVVTQTRQAQRKEIYRVANLRGSLSVCFARLFLLFFFFKRPLSVFARAIRTDASVGCHGEHQSIHLGAFLDGWWRLGGHMSFRYLF